MYFKFKFVFKYLVVQHVEFDQNTNILYFLIFSLNNNNINEGKFN